jgi:hypothetical protein
LFLTGYGEWRLYIYVLHTINRRKANSIGHIWRRYCIPEQVIKRYKEGFKRRGDDEEDINIYFKVFRKLENIVN